MEQAKTATSSTDTSGTHSGRRMVICVCLNAIFGYLLYLMLFEKVEWAGNVWKFATWANFIMSLMVLLFRSDERMKAKLEATGLSVPLWLHLTHDFIVAFICAAFGWFGYGSIFIITGFLQAAAYTKKKD